MADLAPVMLTTAQAAAELGVTAYDIRKYCEAGTIPGAVRLDGRGSPWRVPLHWIQAQLPDVVVVPDDASSIVEASRERATGIVPTAAVPTPVAPARRVLPRPVDSVQTITHTTVNSRPARALSALAWELLDLVGTLDAEDPTRERLVELLAGAADVMDPGAHDGPRRDPATREVSRVDVPRPTARRP
jgi:hypothetical protein